jgi:hypothetical protein
MGAWSGPDPFSGFSNWIGGVLDILRSTLNAVLGVLKRIWDLLWNHFLKLIIQAAINLQKRIKAFLTPIINVIKAIRAYEMQMFNLYVRPIINFIQRLRAALLIFRVLGFKWAATLDNRLAAMESQLTKLWLNVLADFNRVLSYFDLLMDPQGYFRAGTYLATAIRSIGSLFNALQDIQAVPVSAGTAQAQAHSAQMFDLKSVSNNVITTVSGDVVPDYNASYEAVWANLQSMGYTRPS